MEPSPNQSIWTMIHDWFAPALLVILGALSTLGATIFMRHRDADNAAIKEVEKQRELLQGRVAELETQQRVMASSMMPISAAFQQILVKDLTHFHELRTDELLVKIGPPYILTDKEERELAAALEKRISEAGAMMPDSELDAARMLPMVIKRVKVQRPNEAMVVVMPTNDK